jgi:hypothetical protein
MPTGMLSLLRRNDHLLLWEVLKLCILLLCYLVCLQLGTSVVQSVAVFTAGTSAAYATYYLINRRAVHAYCRAGNASYTTGSP